MKTKNRGALLRKAKQGKLYAKCIGHYTDDYAFDAAYNFGIMDNYAKVIINPNVTDEEIAERIDFMNYSDNIPEREQRSSAYLAIYRKKKDALKKEHGENSIFLDEDDFRTKSGGAWQNDNDDYISFNVHSNLNYNLKIIH